jgi:hypothetical protein
MADLCDLEDCDKKCEPFWEHHRTDAQRTSGNSAAGVRPLVTVRDRRMFVSMLFCGRMLACRSLVRTVLVHVLYDPRP